MSREILRSDAIRHNFSSRGYFSYHSFFFRISEEKEEVLVVECLVNSSVQCLAI